MGRERRWSSSVCLLSPREKIPGLADVTLSQRTLEHERCSENMVLADAAGHVEGFPRRPVGGLLGLAKCEAFRSRSSLKHRWMTLMFQAGRNRLIGWTEKKVRVGVVIDSESP